MDNFIFCTYQGAANLLIQWFQLKYDIFSQVLTNSSLLISFCIGASGRSTNGNRSSIPPFQRHFKHVRDWYFPRSIVVHLSISFIRLVLWSWLILISLVLFGLPCTGWTDIHTNWRKLFKPNVLAHHNRTSVRRTNWGHNVMACMEMKQLTKKSVLKYVVITTLSI